nr:Rpn family recombination-promoting nuclease/putative transposase [Leptothoe spongobia]
MLYDAVSLLPKKVCLTGTLFTTCDRIDLLDVPPPDAATYRFDSVAVKEPKFEIDGVFLPPEHSDIKKEMDQR